MYFSNFIASKRVAEYIANYQVLLMCARIGDNRAPMCLQYTCLSKLEKTHVSANLVGFLCSLSPGGCTYCCSWGQMP